MPDRGGVPAELSFDPDELSRKLNEGGPATADDQSVTKDGRRIDSRAAALAFVAELKAARHNRTDLGR